MEQYFGAAIVFGFFVAVYMWWFQKGRFLKDDGDDPDPGRW